MLSINTTLQAAIDLLPDAVIVVNKDIKIVAANPQVFEIFGYHPQELEQQNLNLLIPERFRVRHDMHFRHYFEAPAKRRMGSGFDLFGLRKNGKELDVDIALAPVNISGQLMVMAIIRDITPLKELDRQLLKKNEELSLTNTKLERQGYVIAHDLKSPLLNLQALISLLKRELGNDLPPKVAGYAKLLDVVTISMMNLINGVTQYSTTSFKDTSEEDVNLNDIVNEVRQLVNFPPGFKMEVKGKLPIIRGNKTKILQVFLNLVNNAVKYNDKPEGLVEIGAKASDKVCLINVADNGPGVLPELRGKVFELFRKGAIEKEGSQGIGLAVVKKIIEDRGGHIMVDSSPLGGANFVFSWPAQGEES
ncbi:sensor histidine kinase [Adhaeribacter terreus]|uniref:histidine kinase n=1 Tax=Adhaeribacter terreus TaxID=529703 RepID=A0ABW0EE59_9BACT